MTPSDLVPQDRPLRSDAARNRSRVIDAALAVFAEQGLEATIPDVARRASVGKATVYRSFPTREHLVAAIVTERLTWYRERAEAALDDPDAWSAFTALMFDAADAQAQDRALAACLASVIDLPTVDEARAATALAMDRLMRRAQTQGRMRPGVSSADIRIFFTGASRMLAEAGEHDPALWRRYAGLAVDAFRAEGTEALPLDG